MKVVLLACALLRWDDGKWQLRGCWDWDCPIYINTRWAVNNERDC